MKKLLLLLIALFAIISCETGDINRSSSTHIYAVGNNGSHEAYLTKDGVSSSLGVNYFVIDLFVDGDDVYTSGNKDGFATYTKNGVFNTIGGAGSSASNIYVNGNDVYVVGKQGYSPAYWKNGVQTVMTISSGYKGVAYDVTVSNNDVYIAGYQCNFDYSNLITNILYWKNGVLTTVNSTHTYSFNWIGEISIAVDNNDVYLAVNERDIYNDVFNGNAYLIKNGTEETLIADNSEVHDIFIADSAIYLCGSHISSTGVPYQSVVWKNGTAEVEKDVTHGAFASVVVIDNNIFAVGLDSVINPDGSFSNHGTTLINNVYEVAPDFGSPVFGSGYMSVFVTE